MEFLTFFPRLRAPLAIVLAAAVLGVAGLTGCDDEIFQTVDEDKLSPPLGLRSVTGNEAVTLTWFTSNFEGDFEGYIIYQWNGDISSDQSEILEDNPSFLEVGRIEASSSGRPQTFPVDGLVNGNTYSFAVVAFKNDGDEISRTSNIVADTPRPDILSVTLTSASTNDWPGNDSTAGFDFDEIATALDPMEAVEAVPTNLVAAGYADAAGTDVVHEAFDPSGTANIRSWLAGMNGSGDDGVQDLGYMGGEGLDGSDVAPTQGYAGNGNSVLLTLLHVYAIRTGDGRYGKIIVTDIDDADHVITFNAAFQTKTGEPNYFRALGIRD